MLVRLLRLLAPLETFAQLTWSSNLRPLLLPLPLGEGWSLPRTRSGGEGLPGNHPVVTQRSLLAPRRRSRLFPIFRSRRLRPNPSPPPRTQRPQRRPAVPSQPQHSSPIRQKIRPSGLWPARTPYGGSGWPETAPTSPRHPASRPDLATSPCHNLAHPRHTPIRPSPGLPGRVSDPAKNRPAAPQEFFGNGMSSYGLGRQAGSDRMMARLVDKLWWRRAAADFSLPVGSPSRGGADRSCRHAL